MDGNKKDSVLRFVIFILCVAIAYFLLCTVVNVFTEINELNKAAQQNKEQAKDIWSNFSFSAEMIYMPPKKIPLIDLIPITFFIGLLLFYIINKNLPDKEAKTLHGDDRWARISELRKEFIVIPSKKIEEAEISGTPVAYIHGNYYVDPKNNHTLCIGSTGTGKSQTMALPMARLWASTKDKHNVIINDPKPEILLKTYSIFEENGYDIVILNLRDTDKSSCWNPLSFIIDEYVYCRKTGKEMSLVSEYIDTMANQLTQNPKSDPIWPSAAKSLLKAMILYMIELGYDTDTLSKVTMYNIHNFFVEYGSDVMRILPDGSAVTENRLDTLMQNLPIGSLAKAAYATSKFASGEMRGSIFSTLADDINIFGSDMGVSSLTSHNDIDLNTLIHNSEESDRPYAIFMVVPDDRPSRHVLASMFINQCYLTIIEYLTRNQKESLNRRTDILLDEFCNMVKIPGMDNKITVSRSRNIGWHLFIQSFSYLDSKYENEAKVIRDNCNNLTYINSQDKDTNEYFSSILGNRTVEYRTYSNRHSSEKVHDSENVAAKPLKSPTQLARLKEGEIIVKHLRMFPIFSKFQHFYKLGIREVSIDDIPIKREYNSGLSDCLYPFEIIDNELNKINNAGIPEIIMESHIAGAASEPNPLIQEAFYEVCEKVTGFHEAYFNNDLRKCRGLLNVAKMYGVSNSSVNIMIADIDTKESQNIY